jgi:hypothetical protein
MTVRRNHEKTLAINKSALVQFSEPTGPGILRSAEMGRTSAGLQREMQVADKRATERRDDSRKRGSLSRITSTLPLKRPQAKASYCLTRLEVATREFRALFYEPRAAFYTEKRGKKQNKNARCRASGKISTENSKCDASKKAGNGAK